MAPANVTRVGATLTLCWSVDADPRRMFANVVNALRSGLVNKKHIGDILQKYKNHSPPEIIDYGGGLLNETIKPKRGRRPITMDVRMQRDYPAYQRLEELRAQGKTYDEALEATAREFDVREGTLRNRLTELRKQRGLRNPAQKSFSNCELRNLWALG